MGDLIDRETLLTALRARGRELLKLGTSFEANIASVTVLECVNIVKDMPAVDAEPVVYCRDCVLWKPVDKCTGKCPFLIGEHQYTGAEHYCSCGERPQKEG